MKTYISVTLFSLFSLHSFSQVPDWVWARSAQANSPLAEDESVSVATDHAGNVYTTGIYKDSIIFGSHVLYSPFSGSTGIYLTKYDSSGNVIWARSDVRLSAQGGGS